jgi:hypothetical protein
MRDILDSSLSQEDGQNTYFLPDHACGTCCLYMLLFHSKKGIYLGRTALNLYVESDHLMQVLQTFMKIDRHVVGLCKSRPTLSDSSMFTPQGVGGK